MKTSYHKSAKKATFCLILAIFLFCGDLRPVLAKIPNDPQYQAKMWEQVGAPAAWDFSVGSRKVIVTIIDTGADTWHEDLNDNIWINPNEVPNNGIDDDRNGYVDDINGWNFIENNNNVRTSVFDEKSDAKAVHHGTVLAGLVGAVGNNNRNGVGINWRAQIMPLRAVNSEGEGAISGVIRAVNYAVENGASVISMSLISDVEFSSLREVLRWAYNKGVVIVAAAGNNRVLGEGDLDIDPVYPICFDNKIEWKIEGNSSTSSTGNNENWILGVSSVNPDDRLSLFANFGKCVDILALGESVSSTQRYAPAYNYMKDFGGQWKGTSFAAPIVAGAAALIKSIRPDWGAKEIIKNLLDNADDIDAVNPIFKGRLGSGRLNIGRAAAAAYQNRPGADIFDTIYFYSGNEFFGYKFNENYALRLGSVPDVKIIDIASADVNNDNKKEVVLLISRKPYFYVRVIGANGAMLDEFALSGAKDARKIRISCDENEITHLVAEVYDKKNNKIVFWKYGMDGKKLGEISIKNTVVGWDISADGNLAVAFKNKKDLSLKYLDWENKLIRSWNILKTDSIDDLKIARGENGGGDKIFLIYRQGKSITQAALDLTDGARRDEKIISKNKDKWHLLAGNFGSADGLVIWRFQLNGGIFPVFDYSGGLVKNIKLLKISGRVE